jgi:hypothetical protein
VKIVEERGKAFQVVLVGTSDLRCAKLPNEKKWANNYIKGSPKMIQRVFENNYGRWRGEQQEG